MTSRLLSFLDELHPCYNGRRWSHLWALYKGGEEFDKYKTDFLIRNPVESDEIYNRRAKAARYTNYVGPIVDLYISWMLSASFTVTPSKSDADSEFYARFKEDVGGETDLAVFMRDVAIEALATGSSYCLIQLPSNEGVPAADKQEYDERGLGRATLHHLKREQILDWEEDDCGNFLWVKVHTKCPVRSTPFSTRDMWEETWKIYTPTEVETYTLRYKLNDPRPTPDTVVPGQVDTHGFKRVPIVQMKLAHGLCIGERVLDPQIQHFELESALFWLSKLTCYPVPVFNMEDAAQRPPTLGAGYWIAIGLEEKFGWSSPTVAPFDVLQKNLDAKRDEIYRTVHQMAQGLDNNAETTGRSADSKEIDAAATRILLQTYGQYLSETIEAIFETISEARGEVVEWAVEGFSGYDIATIGSLLGNAQATKTLGIPSKTFTKELYKRLTSAMLPEATETIKTRIRDEIDSAQIPDPTDTPDPSVDTTSDPKADKVVEE